MKELVNAIGYSATLDMLAEECTELAHAALKYSRKLRKQNPTPLSEQEIRDSLIEEIADVKFCMSLINAAVLSEDEKDCVKKLMYLKKNRMINRLGMAEDD